MDKVMSTGTLYLVNAFPMPIRKLSTLDVSYFLDKCWGRGTRTRTDGIRIILRMKDAKIPNETSAPISRTLGNE